MKKGTHVDKWRELRVHPEGYTPPSDGQASVPDLATAHILMEESGRLSGHVDSDDEEANVQEVQRFPNCCLAMLSAFVDIPGLAGQEVLDDMRLLQCALWAQIAAWTAKVETNTAGHTSQRTGRTS